MEAGIALGGWQDVRRDDAGRHGPGRVEDQVVHLRAEQRRLAVGLSDLHARAPHDVLALDDVRGVARDVHDDELLRQVLQQHAAAIEVDAQLADALRERHVEFRDRAGARDAVALEPHARLETAHGCLEGCVVDLGFRRVGGGKVAAHREACAQQRNPRIAHAGLKCGPGRDLCWHGCSLGRTIARELALQADVKTVRRLQRLDAPVNVLCGERLLDFPRHVAVGERAPEVPLRIEALGIHLAE